MGYRSLELASHQAVYMIGSSASGDYLTPTQVTSLTDFTNVFGASPSEASVKLFFRNDKRGILYFVRTPIAKRFKITIDTAAAGAYTTTVNGTQVTYTAPASPSPTLSSVASGLLAAINNSAVASAVTAIAGTDTDEVIVRADNPLANLTVTVTGVNMTVADVTPTTPTATDYIYSIENSFDADDEWTQGFLIAPQAFQMLTSQSDRLAVGNAMEALAADSSFDWVALIDAGADLSIADVQTEAALYASPQGHSSFYYPYVIDLDDVEVPASAGVTGIATRRFKEEGFQQPPAGAKFPMLGVKDVVTKVNNQQQEVLNPLRINKVWALKMGYAAKNGKRYVKNPTGKTLCITDLQKESEWKLKSTLAAFVLQGQEAAFIHELTLLSLQYDYQVISNEHDGLVTVGDIPDEAVQKAAEKSGLKYAKLDEKPLEGIDDIKRLLELDDDDIEDEVSDLEIDLM
ncbi:hypothetical protein ACQFX9_14390 [Aliinostoc sp. HNIBRCY26]|uniref:hypothetical protein n=1 Tax=Aliinostoc sp. HNIBRCY26 TaxID=3418997 RepID=UPI003D017FB7